MDEEAEVEEQIGGVWQIGMLDISDSPLAPAPSP